MSGSLGGIRGTITAELYSWGGSSWSLELILMTDQLMSWSFFGERNSWETSQQLDLYDWTWRCGPKLKTKSVIVINDVHRKWKYLIYNKFRDNYLQGLTGGLDPHGGGPYFSCSGPEMELLCNYIRTGAMSLPDDSPTQMFSKLVLS